jgi:hypothetical protein
MSPELRPAFELARALSVTAEVSRAEEQIARLRTLDVYGHHVREIALVGLVVDVRAGRMDAAQRALVALQPMSRTELRELESALMSTPESGDAEYRRWVRRMLKRSEPADARRRDTTRELLRNPVAIAVAAGCVLGLVVALLAHLLRPPPGPEESLDRMITQIHDGDFRSLWAGFPQLYRDEADRAFRRVAGRVPAQSFEDYRIIDRGLAELVRTRPTMLKGSRCGSIGPIFRTLRGENNAEALAAYLEGLSASQLYDGAWIAQASIADVIGVVTAGEFPACWDTYFRHWVLEEGIWQRMFGISGVTLGRIASSGRNLMVVTPDDGSGLVVVGILAPQGIRVEVPMRSVEGCWIPAALADGWRQACLDVQSSDQAAASAFIQVMQVVPDRMPGLTDARKLLIIEATRANTQEAFDSAAANYFR